MFTNERITAYIDSLDAGDGELCEKIKEQAAVSHVPIIRRETAALLKTRAVFPRPGAIPGIGRRREGIRRAL